ncbi:MAG: NOB1 family endonuclease [Candidatus Baldrarchaeia archaeon]
MNKKVLILDTSAFIGKFYFYLPNGKYITVPRVLNEILDEKIKNVIETYIRSRKIEIKSPGAESIKIVEQVAGETGDLPYISETDKQILALALEYKNKGFKTIIVSDDYAIQNVAKKLAINFVSLVQKGIKYFISWEIYCPACGKRFPPSYAAETCDVCGEKIKRKAVKKKLLRGKENEEFKGVNRKSQRT